MKGDQDLCQNMSNTSFMTKGYLWRFQSVRFVVSRLSKDGWLVTAIGSVPDAVKRSMVMVRWSGVSRQKMVAAKGVMGSILAHVKKRGILVGGVNARLTRVSMMTPLTIIAVRNVAE